MTDVGTRKAILSTPHSATDELTSSIWKLRSGARGFTLLVDSPLGGSLKIYVVTLSGANKLVKTVAIAASDPTLVAIDYRIARGFVGFVPAAADASTTLIQFDPST